MSRKPLAAESAVRKYHRRIIREQQAIDRLEREILLADPFDDEEDYLSIAAYELDHLVKFRHGSLDHG